MLDTELYTCEIDTQIAELERHMWRASISTMAMASVYVTAVDQRRFLRDLHLAGHEAIAAALAEEFGIEGIRFKGTSA
jgi:hypothetical protein